MISATSFLANPGRAGWRRWGLVLSAVLLAACASAASPTNTPQRAIDLQDCQLAAPGSSARVEAKCGALTVPEDRAKPDGRQITLNLAVIPAVSRSPAPDPLFFLSGGPGQAATETYPQLAGAFEQINRKRDIVLVDQRGAGKSNPLQCRAEDDPDLADVTPEQIKALRERLFTECAAKLQAKADLRFYTTSIAMADLDAVRAALGYDQINLYGVSYGTRAALTYLQQYPSHVRAVILDGVAPQDWNIGQYFARDGQRALDLIFQRCAADPSCQAAFPNLRAEIDALIAALTDKPVKVTLPHPATGKTETITLTREFMVSTVRLMSYSTEAVTLLPLLIHIAQAEGNYTPLAAQLLQTDTEVNAVMSTGMQYSVLCTEDVRFTSAEAAQANANSYIGNFVTDFMLQACALWPTGAAPADFKQPVVSDVPVLLLSGEADPVTPPANAEQTARGLRNSLSLVAPGQGHNVIVRGCLPRVAKDFIEAGSVKALDTACVANIQPPPFFLDFTGPKP